MFQTHYLMPPSEFKPQRLYLDDPYVDPPRQVITITVREDAGSGGWDLRVHPHLTRLQWARVGGPRKPRAVPKPVPDPTATSPVPIKGWTTKHRVRTPGWTYTTLVL